MLISILSGFILTSIVLGGTVSNLDNISTAKSIRSHDAREGVGIGERGL